MGGMFFDWAKEANDQGDFFPVRRLTVIIIDENLSKVFMSQLRSYNQVWGTCNGFELLTVLSSRDKSRLTDCDSQVKRRRDN